MTALGFYNVMIVADFGSTITSIKWVDLIAEEDQPMRTVGKNILATPVLALVQ